ncbi:hypothetical protein V3W47_10780 [Deinococcus sp. YIM 134068]|uniref:hypothetical protein n=1 Tax=Deinococcus lichenicola TaxID=3118910 RepID=UPI002F952BCD
MTLEQLRADLARYDVRLSMGEGGRLRYDAAPSLSAEVLDAMRTHKAALLAGLRSPRPEWEQIGAQPGHCGSCARWTPTPYPLEGECSAGRRAHGWYDGNPSAPVLIHPGHRCAADSGQGYRARGAA